MRDSEGNVGERNKKERSRKIDNVRDSLLAGQTCGFVQEVSRRKFYFNVIMEKTDDLQADFDAAEEVACMMVEGGLAL